MFGNVRVAQPPHRRCDADGALEPLTHCDANDLCLPIAKADLFDHVHALEGFIAFEYELNEGMSFGLWPGCRVQRDDGRASRSNHALVAPSIGTTPARFGAREG